MGGLGRVPIDAGMAPSLSGLLSCRIVEAESLFITSCNASCFPASSLGLFSERLGGIQWEKRK